MGYREIIVITHPEVEKGQPNPNLNRDGIKQAEQLLPYLSNPQVFPVVVTGTARCLLETARRCRLNPTRVTPCVGGPEFFEDIGNRQVVILADGTPINATCYTGIDDMIPIVFGILRELPHYSIIICGKPFISILGCRQAKLGSIYIVRIDDNDVGNFHVITPYFESR